MVTPLGRFLSCSLCAEWQDPSCISTLPDAATGEAVSAENASLAGLADSDCERQELYVSEYWIF